ncbi:hypothetical protein [Streptomyces sp. NPDC127100]|uniref:hypothetical protein n=1 Tax=Streptomyces sp. NPDC127100 TaxID=3347138 RepID=UPI00365EAC4F
MAEQDKSLVNVTDDSYDGRDLVPEDNRDGVENYVGVDPIYQNYANETEKPHAFTDEELERAAERGGVVVDANSDEQPEDGQDEDKPARKAAAKKTAATPPTASVPEQKTSSPDSK